MHSVRSEQKAGDIRHSGIFYGLSFVNSYFGTSGQFQQSFVIVKNRLRLPEMLGLSSRKNTNILGQNTNILVPEGTAIPLATNVLRIHLTNLSQIGLPPQKTAIFGGG